MNILEILEDSRLGLSPDSTLGQIKLQFTSYLHLLVKWNKKINLTSEKTAQEILQRHIFDSLHYCRAVFPNDRIIDIGSGAGFPGIPLKIIYPNLNAMLVESQRKRCSFLNAVIHELNFVKTIVVNARAEQILPASSVDVVVLRAVSDINSCLKLAGRFLERGGKVVLKKDPDAKTNKTHQGFTLAEERVVLGYNDKQSNLLIFEKCST
ncbi:16S rRNA (guanine(527)-N(7))-methyltransferase RsmG [Nitrospinae bacterium]|nr:16S rRNA (guanine(527)-N(7))-methyltransferase RsmG [Nitrospinota bacterium]